MQWVLMNIINSMQTEHEHHAYTVSNTIVQQGHTRQTPVNMLMFWPTSPQ